VDTPPLLVANESRGLGQLADGLMLVVRPGVADAQNAIAAKELLKQIDSKVLGLVLNGIETQKEPDSYYHYTHDYHARVDSQPAPATADIHLSL
jgi:polysaccharide biosynthesis transport protein